MKSFETGLPLNFHFGSPREMQPITKFSPTATSLDTGLTVPKGFSGSIYIHMSKNKLVKQFS